MMKRLRMWALLLLCSLPAIQQSYAQCSSGCTRSATTGTYASGSAAVTPAGGEKICIPAGQTVTITGDLTVGYNSRYEVCGTLIIQGTLTVSNQPDDTTPAFLSNSGASVSMTGNLSLLGNFRSDGSLTVTGSATVNGGASPRMTLTGTTSIGGALTISNSVPNSNSGTLTIGTNLTVNGGSNFSNTGTTNTGGTTSIAGTFSNTGNYSGTGDITVNGGASLTNSGALATAGNLANLGTTTSNGGSLNVGGNVTNNGGASINVNGTDFNVTGNFTNTGSTNFGTGSVVEVSGNLTNNFGATIGYTGTGGNCGGFAVGGSTTLNGAVNSPAAVCTDAATCPCAAVAGAGVLPVRLVRFAAERSAQGVLLQWETASEVNNKEFVLLRSRDGQQFAAVATVPGHGTTQLAQTYNWLDETAQSGRLWYQLEQVDYDGQRNSGPVVEVDGIQGQIWQVLPNPLTGPLQIVLLTAEVSAEAKHRVALLTQTGVPVYRGAGSLPQVTQGLEGFLRELPSGVYLLEIATEGHRAQFRLLRP